MEKYARVLVIIFFLIIINLGLNLFILNKLNKQSLSLRDKPVITPPVIIQKTATPSAQVVATPHANMQTDLNLIKAELRALREALNTTGLITVTPEP